MVLAVLFTPVWLAGFILEGWTDVFQSYERFSACLEVIRSWGGMKYDLRWISYFYLGI